MATSTMRTQTRITGSISSRVTCSSFTGRETTNRASTDDDGQRGESLTNSSNRVNRNKPVLSAKAAKLLQISCITDIECLNNR